MKKIIHLFIAFFIVHTYAKAQTVVFDNLKRYRSGVIVDNNNDVDGYYFFYTVDKLKKRQREFAIKILDNELNIVAVKKIVDSKHTSLIGSVYNNKEMLFLFANYIKKEYRIVSFNKKGEKAKDERIEISRKELKWLKDGGRISLIPVDNRGFIFTTVVKNKKMGYKMRFISSLDGQKSWDITSPEQAKKILSIRPMKTSEDYIIAFEGSRKTKRSKRMDFSINVIDAKTGKSIFEKPYTREKNPRLVTNTFIDGDEFIILGEYFKPGDNIFTKKSQGLFVERLNTKGKKVASKKVSWENKLFRKLQAGRKTNKRTYSYFHDVIKADDGSFYAIGELYQKVLSASGLLDARIGKPITELVITDAVVYHFDKNFSLIDLEIFKKGKSRITSLSDFSSPQLNAHLMASSGRFDFISLQTDPNTGRFYANFLDYNRYSVSKLFSKEKQKASFISIIYDKGKLSVDKVPIIEKRGHSIRVYPAKLGHVMIMNYHKKKKQLSMYLEKINIE